MIVKIKLTKLFMEFFNNEQSSGIVLMLCTVASLLMANSSLGQGYLDFWHIKAGLEVGDFSLKYSIDHWINDGHMMIFFLLIGLEVERELYIGELSDLKNASLLIFPPRPRETIADVRFGILGLKELEMVISRHMKRDVVSIHAVATVREAAAIFVKKHIGLLPVVDDDNKPIGIVSLKDLLALELPDFVSFIADVDFVHDFGAVEDTRPSANALDKSVKSLVKPAITVDENDGLLRAYALMLQHDLHDILVVSKDGKLAGIASRVDIGTAILSTWKQVE